MMLREVLTISVGIFFMSNFLCGCQGEDSTQTVSYKEEEYDVEDIWEKKVRYVCEMDCKDFDNPEKIKKGDILEICQYYKSISESNIEYNEEMKKYIISEREVKDIVEELFGIEDFVYEEEGVYDKERGLYIFDEYIGYFDDETYEGKEFNRIDDERYEFKITVKDGEIGTKREERYILKRRGGDNFYITTKETQ